MSNVWYFTVCCIHLLSFGLLQSSKQTESAASVCLCEWNSNNNNNKYQSNNEKNTGSAISKTTIIVFKSVALMGNFCPVLNSKLFVLIGWVVSFSLFLFYRFYFEKKLEINHSLHCFKWRWSHRDEEREREKNDSVNSLLWIFYTNSIDIY